MKVSLGLVVLWCAVMHGVLLGRVVLYRLARKAAGLKSAPTHANTIGICWIFVEVRTR